MLKRRILYSTDSCAKVVYEHGGICFVNAHVDEILIKNNKAVGVRVCKATSWENKKGTDEKVESIEVFAPIVINAAGMTYCKKIIKKSIKFFFIILKNDIKIRADWKHYNELST